MLCFACLQSFFLVVKFCHWATIEKWAWQGPKGFFQKKKLLKVVLKFAISRHLLLTCCQNPYYVATILIILRKKIFFQTNFCTYFYKNFTKFPFCKQTNPFLHSKVYRLDLVVLCLCVVFFSLFLQSSQIWVATGHTRDCSSCCARKLR